MLWRYVTPLRICRKTAANFFSGSSSAVNDNCEEVVRRVLHHPYHFPFS